MSAIIDFMSQKIEITDDAFVKAVSDELKSHFRWTSVEGLVELEADCIARSAFSRLLLNE